MSDATGPAQAGADDRSPVRDGARLAVGTLTVLPTPQPRVVDRRSGSWAMTLAPLVGGVLAVPALLLLWLLPAPAAVMSVLVVGLLALLTRGIHLDGLADTADGLGSGPSAENALAVMRRGDIGPFGVVTLVLVLLLQVAALAALLEAGRGPLAVGVALVASRLVLPLACSRGVPAARPGGLGRTVAGTVSRRRLALSAALTAGLLLVLAFGTSGFDLAEAAGFAGLGLVAAGVGLLAGAALCWWCVRRLGGVTGDVLGSCVEAAFATVLVTLSVL
jgi:adenosylcobinamide-GDP ribazoletransferase